MKRLAAVCTAFLLLAPLAFSQSSPCSDPMAVMRSFYQATDSHRFAEGMKYFTDDATFDTWATGVQGYIMAKRHLAGKKQIGAYLKDARGLRHRLPDSPPDGPIYHETRLSASGSAVQFMLEPDRKRPNGREYNPFTIEVTFDGCRIKSLTVIERVTWL